uniref:hypothetical protein n=1 Tax=Actinacidiphila soli TaxID=2487275 RepID=UPI0019D0C1B4
MRVSRLAASLGVATAVLLGGATDASATTSAPSLATQATYNRGVGLGDCGPCGFGPGDGFGPGGFGPGDGFGPGGFGPGDGFGP